MDLAVLKTELTDDPLTRGYSGMSDEAAAADLLTAYRTRNMTSMSGDVIFQQTDSAEFAALTDIKKQLWMAFCGRDSINPVHAANVAFVQWVFGVGSDTVSSLAAARVENITRAAELGLGAVRAGDVQRARAE